MVLRVARETRLAPTLRSKDTLYGLPCFGSECATIYQLVIYPARTSNSELDQEEIKRRLESGVINRINK